MEWVLRGSATPIQPDAPQSWAVTDGIAVPLRFTIGAGEAERRMPSHSSDRRKKVSPSPVPIMRIVRIAWPFCLNDSLASGEDATTRQHTAESNSDTLGASRGRTYYQ